MAVIRQRSPQERAARVARRAARAAVLHEAFGGPPPAPAKPVRSRIRARRQRERRSERVLDPGIVEAVHQLPCAAAGMPGARHRGPIEADHIGPHPYGRRSHDTEVAPLCRACHRNRTNPRTGGSGWFDRLTPSERLAWRRERIAIVQTWYYGRPLTAGDLKLVVEAVNDNRPTRGLLAAPAARAA
jgi:5-methylcytosine-specific restriction endonuclease McrA